MVERLQYTEEAARFDSCSAYQSSYGYSVLITLRSGPPRQGREDSCPPRDRASGGESSGPPGLFRPGPGRGRSRPAAFGAVLFSLRGAAVLSSNPCRRGTAFCLRRLSDDRFLPEPAVERTYSFSPATRA